MRPAMDTSHLGRNEEQTRRLTALVARLSDEDLDRPLGDGWTVAAALAHVAFWDRVTLARLARYERDGELPGVDVDLVNEAALEAWRAIPPREATRLVLAAAEAFDRKVAGVAPQVAAELRARGYERMLDRSAHRREHLDQIERALAG
jgi:Mycothiol maleylpyruvate isomerase N-terminal domain